ncbi:MAG: bifunctional 4-hydroxy-2-oxoglutarate aldolase/2-dehydro-3-deoxy-phosphogluconate aldolase [Ectothiorhodospiraceae bacterium]|nr:bifunctional 4-hydroxy-2-oxoglutarate aldolase/2-dehydro-3-deoxy-phosphogluconate aldolase [Chromatiales bacterium]MCP5157263.1 bifunctional 4-hydroxy-2-oxoglutarate aldolase/2-dehydro-3-deoxy-phosphogluconate aldolase [Ectothiorhodospiraceae bacterium]
MQIEPILRRAPVVPVLTVKDPDQGLRLAEALVRGGLPVVEITLRTRAAPEAIRRIGEALPEAVVGAGTVTTAEQLTRVRDLGARFAVSPGATDALLAAASVSGIPFLPGVSTASESMRALAAGFRYQKFFPAEACGGIAFLRSLAAPLPEARFCPTGGVSAANAGDYLACPNVVCVGGSWVAPADAVASGDWARIERLAREASALGAAR